MKGFLGTGATFEADLNLVVQLIMGVALLAGALLARHKRYRAHGICQTTVLLLNLLMIGLVVLPATSRAGDV
jgi:Ca2+/H+ antiporter